MKKCILIVCLLCLVLTGCFYDLFDATPKGYIDKVEHFDENGWLDSTDYAYYQYKSDGEKLFKNNGDFLKVKNDDIKVLGEFYDHFKNMMSMSDRENEFEMQKSQITEGDYYRIENWWYGEKEQEDWFKFSKDDDDVSTDNASGFKTKTIDETGRMRLVKTSDKDAVRYSLNMYYSVYIYDTENSTLYYLHNDT